MKKHLKLLLVFYTHVVFSQSTDISNQAFRRFIRAEDSKNVLNALTENNICYNVKPSSSIIEGRIKSAKIEFVPLYNDDGFVYRKEQKILFFFKRNSEIGAYYERAGIVYEVDANGKVVRLDSIINCILSKIENVKSVDGTQIPDSIIKCVNEIRENCKNGTYQKEITKNTFIGDLLGIKWPRAKMYWNGGAGVKRIYNKTKPCLAYFNEAGNIISYCWKRSKK